MVERTLSRLFLSRRASLTTAYLGVAMVLASVLALPAATRARPSTVVANRMVPVCSPAPVPSLPRHGGRVQVSWPYILEVPRGQL